MFIFSNDLNWCVYDFFQRRKLLCDICFDFLFSGLVPLFINSIYTIYFLIIKYFVTIISYPLFIGYPFYA